MNVKFGVYEHYKGNGKKYRVIGVAKHSETLEDMVVYEALYDNEVSKLWVRSLEMFVGEVEFNSEAYSPSPWGGVSLAEGLETFGFQDRISAWASPEATTAYTMPTTTSSFRSNTAKLS